MSRFRKSAALVLITTLWVSIAAPCLIGHDAGASQMACCVGTDHDCGAPAIAEGCCQSERAEQEPLPVHLQPNEQPAPLAGVARMLVHAPPLSSLFEIQTTPVRSSPPPTYLLLATFLI